MDIFIRTAATTTAKSCCADDIMMRGVTIISRNINIALLIPGAMRTCCSNGCWKREGVLNLAAVPRLLQNCRNARGPSKLNMPKQPWLPKECCPVRAHLAVVQGMMGKQNICQQHLHRSNCRIASRVQSLQAWTTEQGHCPRTSGRHQGWATPMYISPDFSMNRTGAP